MIIVMIIIVMSSIVSLSFAQEDNSFNEEIAYLKQNKFPLTKSE